MSLFVILPLILLQTFFLLLFIVKSTRAGARAKKLSGEFKAVKEKEESLSLALNGARDGVWDWHIDENVVRYNDLYYTMAGYEPGEFPQEFDQWKKRVLPEDLGPILQKIQTVMEGKAPFFDGEFRFLRKDGRYMWIRARGNVAAYDREGKPLRFVGTHTDISRLKRTEEELAHLRNYLKNIIDSMPSLVAGIDGENRVVLWNRTAESITGIPFSRAKDRDLSDTLGFSGLDYEKVRDSMESGQTYMDRILEVDSRGEATYYDIVLYPLESEGARGAVLRMDNVTDKVRLEEVLVQNEKMLSVGGLAAGMAHEINNPLVGILSNVEMIEKRMTDPTLPANIAAARELDLDLDRFRKYMDRRNILDMMASVRSSGVRIAGIVENMLNFARKSEATHSTHDVRELVDDILELTATDYDLKKRYDFKTIEIVREYEDDIPLIPCDRSRLQQVLLNLFRNGAYAMQEKKDALGDGYAPRFILRISRERGGNMIRIEVEDNGPGIDERDQKRIFEPFFTTKPVGVGTGLGLSVSYFIITENHGGTMEVRSIPGEGAVFIIRLPLSSPPMTKG